MSRVENPECPHCAYVTELKAYIRLKPMSTRQIDIGDIVKLTREGEERVYLGKVTDVDEQFIYLNNIDMPFGRNHWAYEVLHSDFDKE